MNYKVKIISSPLLNKIRLDKLKVLEGSKPNKYVVFDTDTYTNINLCKFCGIAKNIKKRGNDYYCDFEISDTDYGRSIRIITNEIYYEFIPFEVNNDIYFAISYSPPF